MKKRSRRILAAHFALAVLGLGAGWLSPASGPQQRFPSSALRPREEAPRLTWDEMACPTEEEYRRLAAIVKLDVPAGVDVCVDPHHNKIARLLAWTEKLKMVMAPDWAPALQPDLANPLAYLGRMSRKMGIDLGQSTSIAYNRGKEIYLGGLFFQEDPLEALSVLVHEARHSSDQDPAHTECRRGDIPKASGGCDAQLTTDPAKAGAYSYGAAFYAALGLYGEGISSSDREYLLALSLATISTRFNEIPEDLAQAFDLISVLDEEGGVHLLHPFAREPVPLALTFLQEGEKVQRLDFNVKNNGLLLFTSKNRLFTWDSAGGFKRLYADTVPENMPVYDAARMRVPFDDYPFYNFLTAENQIYFYRFSPSRKPDPGYELAPYPVFNRRAPVPEINRLFMGLAARSLFLGKDGQIYVGPRYGDELPFDPRADLQVPGRRWTFGTGGVVFESLYGITDDGRVQYTKIELLPPEGDATFDTEVYSVRESSFQPPGGRTARKLFEGLAVRGLLDTEGDLQIEAYGREQKTFWRKLNAKAVDFTILRKHLVSRALIATPDRTAFGSACGVKAPVPDPWLGVGMGLNANGELVVGLPAGSGVPAAGQASGVPCLITGSKRYKELKFRTWRGARTQRQAQESGTSAFVDSPSGTSAVIWATEMNGQVTPLLPYDYK